MIEWTEQLSTLDWEIDNQHKILINLINEVSDTLKAHEYNYLNVLDVVSALDNYVTEHFQYEETLMKKINYPAIENHKEQHNDLRQKMAILNVSEIEPGPKFFFEILGFLVNWLSNHIMKTDRKLGEYINSEVI